jgi:hypothetical protein
MRTFACLLLLWGCNDNKPTFIPNPDLAGPGFKVGGVVVGVRGKLILANNGDLLQVTMDGPFSFFDPLRSGDAYDVTVFEQPSNQVCIVDGGQGTIAGADVMSVQVTCTDIAETIRGTVTGLKGTLVLQNNGADDLIVMQDGPFTFSTRVAHDDSYDVTVAQQPASQTCTVSMGSGVATSDVSDVMVACVDTFSVGVTVTGLNGTVTLQDNGGDDLTITADGDATFAGRLLDGDPYDVTVSVQPIGQRCTVAGGRGSISSADVSGIAVTCVNVHTVGGTVSGLSAGSILLRNNGSDSFTVSFPLTSFTFLAPVAEGAAYDVQIAVQPTGQQCAIANGSGVIGTSDVGDVSVTCVVLQVKLDEVLARPGTGSYGDTNGDGVRDSFDDEFVEIVNLEPSPVPVSGWAVRTGGAAPATRFVFPADTTLQPGQRAVVFGGGTPTGSFGGALVFTSSGLSLTDAPTAENVVLDSLPTGGARLDSFSYDANTFGTSCTTKCASQTRDPSGTGSFVGHASQTVSGSTGILWSPGVAPGQAIPKVAGTFSAPAAGSSSASMVGSMTVQLNMFMQPLDFDAAHFQLFASTCAVPANPVPLGSVVAGTDGSRVVITPSVNLSWASPYCVVVTSATRSANNTTLGSDGSYSFSTVNPGPTYTIGGNISGLSGTVVLQNQGGDDLPRSSPGPYAFVTPWPNGADYSVAIKTQPAGQVCAVDGATPDPAAGQVPGRDVHVDFLCKTVHALGGTVSGLQLGSVTLLNNGGDAQIVSFGGSQNFAFPPVAEGDSYDVTVGAQPTGQNCTVTAGSGTMGGSDVNLAVTCAKLNVVIDEVHMEPADWAYGDANGDGVRDSTQDEFIELLNQDSVDADMNGWVIQYGGAFTRHTITSSPKLQPGQRMVIFGGGAPTGSFGTALVRTGLSTSIGNTSATVTLLSKSSGGLLMDTFSYSGRPTCNNNCASKTRTGPNPTDNADHSGVVGPGVLWSPGTAPANAIPKLAPKFSFPPGGSLNASIIGLIAQFNMYLNSADLVVGNFHLYASTCDMPQNEVPMSLITNLVDNSWVTVSPSPFALAFDTTYCLTADGAMHSGASPSPATSLGATQSFEFHTRNQVSAPASNIVISEVGGCRVQSSGTNPCGGLNNDEFVELYNPTDTPVDITGWSVQRRSSGGSTNCWITLTNPSPSPSPIMVASHGYYLMGGPNYVAGHYFGTPASDYPTPGAGSITGVDESIVLMSGANCSSTSPIVDSVSIGNISERPGFLSLPSLQATIASNTSVERKACYNSTEDADLSTTMLVGGSHELMGNSEKIGGSNADFLPRPSPNPQNSRSGATESRSCP